MTARETAENADDEIRFATDSEAPADVERLHCLAACVLNQQAAGFGNYIDARESKCPDCGASGFNTGWGYWAFACGNEICSDGTPSGECAAAIRSGE